MSAGTIRHVLAGIVTVLVAVVSIACQAGKAAPSTVGGVPGFRIDNFGQVSATYFRGAEPDDAQYPNLAAFGIRTVVDLRDDADPEDRLRVEQSGMRYVHIPMSSRETPSLEVVRDFLRVVDTQENQPVFVHCVGGRHRTGVMTAAYRMVREGWTAARAFKEMKAYKFGPDSLHPEFKRFIFGFQPLDGRHQ